MAAKARCPNMNHGRAQISIRHCPDCGQVLNGAAGSPCNEEVHASRRKNRNVYCHDCGKRLAAGAAAKR